MIGLIIKEKRLDKGWSQKKLAEGICTNKYISLIETNQRNPSVNMLNKLSKRLEIDLFEYYQYFHLENPSIVLEYKRKFERYIQLGDLEKLRLESNKAAKLPMFQSKPLIYDITIINLLYEGIVEGKNNQAIEKIKKILRKENLKIDPLTRVNGYIALSTLYQLKKQLDKARNALFLAYELIKDKGEFSRYQITCVSLLISLTSLLYHEENYNELTNCSQKLLAFQKKHNEYNRIYYGEFYLSIGYYQKKQFVESKKHFMRALYSMTLFENNMDIKFIKNKKIFGELVEYFSIDLDEIFI